MSITAVEEIGEEIARSPPRETDFALARDRRRRNSNVRSMRKESFERENAISTIRPTKERAAPSSSATTATTFTTATTSLTPR